jgi:hypothetical protein
MADFTATILSGASLSNIIDLGGQTLARIRIPSAWTAANITFLVGSAAPLPYYDELGNEITVVAGADRSIRMPPLDWDGVRYIQLRSGTLAVPVPQAADRLITVITAPRN